MTGKEAVFYLENVPWQGTRLGLARTQELLEKLGNPEKQLRFIHIAGTNGKGSTAAMTAAVLKQAGYTVGLYTSPYLQVFHERMRVNGAMITDDELGTITEAVRAAAETMDDAPTEFELMTAIAFLFFLQRRCDLVVLEVGMGGRLDSTNVIPAPEVAVICNIGLDHVKELGDTPEKIAFEKAGIIKAGTDVVLYEPALDGVRRVVEDVCRERGAVLHAADFSQLRPLEDDIGGQRFDYKTNQDLKIRLLGEHQQKNAAVVLEVMEVLRRKGYAVGEDAIRAGLASARWPGRFEVLHTAPVFIADGGHNRQCAEAVARACGHYFPGQKLILIMGVLADKDYSAMAEQMAPLAKEIFTVRPDSPRALSAEQLAEELQPYGVKTTACRSAAEAVERAFACAEETDVICSVGSLYMTGEVRTAVLQRTETK